MSKHETWRTREYWERIGGMLIEEFVAVKGTKDNGRRLMDGLIVLGEQKRIFEGQSFDIEGKDVVIIQTKANRVGMSLMGQAFFSRELVEKLKPKSIKTVAVCSAGDSVMEELAQKYNIEVAIIN